MNPFVKPLEQGAKALGSLKLTLFCLIWLMVLVAACTLAQPSAGNYEAVRRYIRSPLAFGVLPGGGVTGLLLVLNLAAAQLFRLELSWRKAGLWLTHLGLLALFLGEFATAAFQVDTQVALRTGQTADYAESLHEAELAFQPDAPGAAQRVFAVADGRLAAADLPFSIDVLRHGARRAADDSTIPWVELRIEGTQPAIAPTKIKLGYHEHLVAGGRSFTMTLRPRRYALPARLTLKRFIHEKYAGTDIPKRFASVVGLENPATGEKRDAVISMNEPLRYGGRAFYQASFGEMGALSVLQVVTNPAWTIPYAACALMAAGLLGHFLARLRAARPRP